jgi:hypothetical protein
MPSFGGAQQISQHHGKAIEMSYLSNMQKLNNVPNGFENQLRRVVNTPGENQGESAAHEAIFDHEAYEAEHSFYEKNCL